ncbi:unnamed protein product [Medioppia subpectinata]|uniref:Uncharacterized protein n=1 Tax=Medioppia subpectinata TaxID=1979941 RepID=A0A7R9KTB2_9ACAR|nr:unnamed protein product [Medioppia subpectinata]CAG2109124.1 unnamed protein product [Medioppia subpectinata]
MTATPSEIDLLNILSKLSPYVRNESQTKLKAHTIGVGNGLHLLVRLSPTVSPAPSSPGEECQTITEWTGRQEPGVDKATQTDPTIVNDCETQTVVETQPEVRRRNGLKKCCSLM